jgi:hypothetical protein
VTPLTVVCGMLMRLSKVQSPRWHLMRVPRYSVVHCRPVELILTPCFHDLQLSATICEIEATLGSPEWSGSDCSTPAQLLLASTLRATVACADDSAQMLRQRHDKSALPVPSAQPHGHLTKRLVSARRAQARYQALLAAAGVGSSADSSGKYAIASFNAKLAPPARAEGPSSSSPLSSPSSGNAPPMPPPRPRVAAATAAVDALSSVSTGAFVARGSLPLAGGSPGWPTSSTPVR